MQLPLDLKWRQSRNKRSLLRLYGALALAMLLAIMLVIWSLPRLVNGLRAGMALWLDPESRRLILGMIATGILAIGMVIALSRGVVVCWRFMTIRIWQIPKRYAAAIERLSNEQLESRLKGIRTLNRVAKLAVNDQGAIVRTLAGFVQERASIYPRGQAMARPEVQTIAADIQAALTVIGCKPLICRLMWRFVRKVYREGEQQIDQQINAINTINIGLTNLSKARLCHANLREANLYRTNLQRADLRHINLQQANLQGADLKACSLHSANLQAANLQHSNLQDANLHKAHLQKANLYSANLGGATLHSANLQAASLQSANLQAANLRSANLKGAFLYGANLQDADLQAVNLQGTFLTEANLQGANLYKANLQGVTGLTEAQLYSAKLCMTVLPDGSISDRHCTEIGTALGTALGTELGAEMGLCDRPQVDNPRQEPPPPQPSPG